jgi:dihydroflavonol-4-reductase
MKALVIGASGHVGNSIVRALLDRKWEVTACGRRPRPPVNLAGLPLTYLSGDASTPGQLERWIEGHDLVVDGAAPYPMSLIFPGSTPQPDPFITAEMRTRQLLEATLKHNAVLAYVGSFVTLVSPQTTAQRARARMIELTLPYFEVKRLIESQVLEAARRGLRSVIINPTYCLGPWDLHDRRICTIPLLLSGEIPGAVTQLLNVIDVRDVATALMAAIDRKLYGKPLLLTGHNIATNDLYNLVCQLGGVAAPRITAPSNLAMMAMYGAEVLFSALGQQTPVISGGLMMAAAFDYLVPDQTMPTLGVTPRPLPETIADAIGWYRRIGYC